MRATNISWIPGWLLRISKNRSKYRIEIIRRSKMNFHSVVYRGVRYPSLWMPMTAKFPIFAFKRIIPDRAKILFFFLFFFIIHREWKMYAAILIGITIKIQIARNESIRVTRSCHFSRINCDFFFSRRISSLFRISLDNEKDILRRLWTTKIRVRVF